MLCQHGSCPEIQSEWMLRKTSTRHRFQCPHLISFKMCAVGIAPRIAFGQHDKAAGTCDARKLFDDLRPPIFAQEASHEASVNKIERGIGEIQPFCRIHYEKVDVI